MHFHDIFAYFFLVVSLSCCHKQTSSVPLFFIIHKSNNVESEERKRERERELLCGRVRRPRLRISCSQLAPSPHFPSPFRPLFIPICRLLSQGSILRSYPLLLYLGVVAVDSPLARRGRTTAPSFYSSRCESSRAIQLPARLLIPWVIVRTNFTQKLFPN